MLSNYHKINVYTGWGVWLVASIVFLMTMESSTSFWDCGEFISSAYKLQVGHPPGAPLYMLFARFFAMWFGPENVAMAMNALSAFCSSFTILFLFWSITHFAKKAVKGFNKGELTESGTLAVMGSGIVGALAYTFSDSFWFSAVEGEVYAMSSLFTAVVFWAILKWESVGEDAEGGGRGGSLRWIVLIAYLMGLSIGVHLLNLLAIPAIAFVFYFKRYQVTIQGLLTTGIVSLIALGFIQTVIIQGSVGTIGHFEKYFVNDLGFTFNSGLTLYFIALVVVLIGGIVVTQLYQNRFVVYGIIAALLGLLGYFSMFNSAIDGVLELENIWAKSFITLVILVGICLLVHHLSKKRFYRIVNLGFVCTMVILIGYSTFALIYIRSAANPPMDENNPENVFTLKSYLNREQYGSRPLLTGQYWNTPIDYEDPYSGKSNNYVKSFSVKNQDGNLVKSFKFGFQAEEYIDENSSQRLEYVEEYLENESIDGYNYLPGLTGFLPRMHSTDAGDIRVYKEWSDWKEYTSRPSRREKFAAEEAKLKKLEQDIQYSIGAANYFAAQGNREQARAAENEFKKQMRQLKSIAEKLKPSVSENMRFFGRYQIDWMYWRYFMWNFSGKQNDVQGHGGIMKGNWLTGLDFIDEHKLGNRDKISTQMEENRGLNKFYLLPFLLGLIGLVFQLIKNPKDFSVTAILFILTGLAIVVYLNQDPFQPRERDYAYVGSFYAFAIWIGLGVTGLYYAAMKMTKNEWIMSSAAGLAIGIVLYLAELTAGGDHFVSLCILYMSGIAAVLLTVMKFGLQNSLPAKTKSIVVSAICLAVPFLMMSDGWDDHNRSGRRTGVDFASNYLNSLEPNALIFTNGDNDTFPLWYAQEVEGIRTDVRVVNLSLLQTDWYADQMKRQAYEGAPVPIGLTEEQYRQGNRDMAEMDDIPQYVELADQFNFFLDDAKFQRERTDPYFPSNKWKLTIDKEDILRKGVVAEKDTALIVDEMKWTRSGRLIKNSILVYDIIRTNNWERPIYFASTIGEDAYNGLSEYFQLEGLAYRLVPIKTPSKNLQTGRVETDKMYRNVMERFKWGNMDDVEKNVYIDENHTRMLSGLRIQFTNLADALTEEGKPEKAIEVLDKCFEVMPEEIVPFDNMILYLALEYAEAGATDKSDILFEKLFDQTLEKLEYYDSLDPELLSLLIEEVSRDNQLLDATIGYVQNTSQNSDFKERFLEKGLVVDSLFQNMNTKLLKLREKPSKRF